mmetsp:Transcript_111323/g.255322  ORF Transcript_111323/g.255322 Transcript_111323/m.255322 type:complete len:235 (-) Transcript_111323:16-720(-)
MPDILGMAPRPNPESLRLVSIGLTCFPLGSNPIPRSIARPKLSTETLSNCSLSVSGRIFNSSSYKALSACLPCVPCAFRAFRFSHKPEFCMRMGTAASASRCAAEVSPLASALISSKAAWSASPSFGALLLGSDVGVWLGLFLLLWTRGRLQGITTGPVSTGSSNLSSPSEISTKVCFTTSSFFSCTAAFFGAAALVLNPNPPNPIFLGAGAGSETAIAAAPRWKTNQHNSKKP